MSSKIYTLAERPELRSQVSDIGDEVWPAFMKEDAVANRAWPLLFEAWGEFQLALCGEDGRVIAAAEAMPLVWDGAMDNLPYGWETSAEQAMLDYERGRAPTTLSAYAIVVSPDHQGHGHSSTMLRAMAANAKEHGLHSVIACVRPTLKASYPLTPIERYAEWQQEDGLPFDPWLRVHWRAGARIERIAHRAMVIKGTVADWESWTGLRFPESGQYVVQGALQPITIDCEKDMGEYVDPNIWMIHRV